MLGTLFTNRLKHMNYRVNWNGLEWMEHTVKEETIFQHDTCVRNDLTVNRDEIVTVGEVISSSCVRHTLGISPAGGKTQTSDKLAHPATLTILGSKVSTCFRSAFMVFPVSTMA